MSARVAWTDFEHIVNHLETMDLCWSCATRCLERMYTPETWHTHNLCWCDMTGDDVQSTDTCRHNASFLLHVMPNFWTLSANVELHHGTARERRGFLSFSGGIWGWIGWLAARARQATSGITRDVWWCTASRFASKMICISDHILEAFRSIYSPSVSFSIIHRIHMVTGEMTTRCLRQLQRMIFCWD